MIRTVVLPGIILSGIRDVGPELVKGDVLDPPRQKGFIARQRGLRDPELLPVGLSDGLALRYAFGLFGVIEAAELGEGVRRWGDLRTLMQRGEEVVAESFPGMQCQTCMTRAGARLVKDPARCRRRRIVLVGWYVFLGKPAEPAQQGALAGARHADHADVDRLPVNAPVECIHPVRERGQRCRHRFGLSSPWRVWRDV